MNASELSTGLEKLGVICDVSKALLIVERYDADKDRRLGFWEFSNALLPIQPGLRDEVERKRAQWDISNDTRDIFRKTLRRIIDAEVMIESIRQRINREKLCRLRSAFDSLDWLTRGFITDNEFKRAFEKISDRLGS